MHKGAAVWRCWGRDNIEWWVYLPIREAIQGCEFSHNISQRRRNYYFAFNFGKLKVKIILKDHSKMNVRECGWMTSQNKVESYFIRQMKE